MAPCLFCRACVCVCFSNGGCFFFFFQRSRERGQDILRFIKILQLVPQANFSNKNTRKINNKDVWGFIYVFTHLKIFIFRCHEQKVHRCHHGTYSWWWKWQVIPRSPLPGSDESCVWLRVTHTLCRAGESGALGLGQRRWEGFSEKTREQVGSWIIEQCRFPGPTPRAPEWESLVSQPKPSLVTMQVKVQETWLQKSGGRWQGSVAGIGKKGRIVTGDEAGEAGSVHRNPGKCQELGSVCSQNRKPQTVGKFGIYRQFGACKNGMRRAQEQKRGKWFGSTCIWKGHSGWSEEGMRWNLPCLSGCPGDEYWWLGQGQRRGRWWVSSETLRK